MIIAVSGSSGTGKSTIASNLAKKLKYKYLDLNKFIKEKKLTGKYIKNLDTYEVDIDKLNNYMKSFLKNNDNLIVDSHLSHYLPSKYTDYCVICKCDLKVLKKRLKLKGYNDTKIRENLNSEIFDVCLVEATENKHNVIIVDTSRKNVNACVNDILKKIKKLDSKSSVSF